jgi:acetyltransferase
MRPDAHVDGFTVQPMARRPGAHELIVGIATDPVFGPVMLFGQGGTAVEVIGDKALALPPLNLKLAREMIERTRVFKLLAGYRDRPPADLDAVAITLVKVSQLLVDLGEVVELDINPLWADQDGVLALDARIRIASTERTGAERMAIRPYPRKLEEEVTLAPDLRVLLRPIRPEDEPAHMRFHAMLTPEDIYFRFFGAVREMPHSQMARYTQIDYDREMAFIAVDRNAGSAGETLGVVRAVFDPDNTSAEFAIIIRSDVKGHGLGHVLLEKILRYCRDRGTGEIVGQVLASNERMLALARACGFTLRRIDGSTVEVRLALDAPSGSTTRLVASQTDSAGRVL